MRMRLAPNPELDALLARARGMPPMTPAEIQQQRISFVFGQMMDCAPHVTRQQIAASDEARYGTPGAERP